MAESVAISDSRNYKATALVYAKAEGWSPSDARSKAYVEIAIAAGVKVEINGDSPADFFYVGVRNHVANTLGEDEVTSSLESEKAAILTELKTLPIYSSWPDAVLLKRLREVVG